MFYQRWGMGKGEHRMKESPEAYLPFDVRCSPLLHSRITVPPLSRPLRGVLSFPRTDAMPISLVQSLRDTPLAFVDVETTGASADFGHRVIELGIARVEGGVVTRTYAQLIDPLRQVGPGITALTGITQQMVDGQPTFEQQLPAAMELLRDAVIIGHNVRFDLGFLNREFRRACADMVGRLGRTQMFDTVRIARKLFGRGGNGLQRLAWRMGVEPAAAHRALADAITTAGVFERMLAPLGGWDLLLVDVMQRQGGPMGLLPMNAAESLLPLELEEALDQKKPVVMEYLDVDDRRTERVIRPERIRRSRQELVLIAFCELRQARRTFKVERIVQLKRMDAIAPFPGQQGVLFD